MRKTFTTASANELENVGNQAGRVAGFWHGLWHGLIAPFTFAASLFREGVGVYEAHNNGSWYNFGFLLGLMVIFGGNRGASPGSRGPGRRKKPDTDRALPAI
ncbi:MAG TPA: hypothetical protein VJ768_09760 [Anaerolineales bacterium]|nr:hypothetical protein [Anaerolineales bacterium]